MYLGDPRESLVDLQAPGVWEADNRVEERWQWGAQLLDLCDLSPEEYKNSTAVTVKTIQDCGECGGGGGGSTSDNKGVASLNDSGEFSVSFDEPVASTLYVFVKFKDSDFEEYEFVVKVPKGSDGASTDISSLSPDAPYEIVSIELGFKEDGSDAGDTVKDKKYEYSVTVEGGDDKGKTYVISILCTETDGLTAEDYLGIIQTQGQGYDFVASYDEINFGDSDAQEATFYALCSHVDEYMPPAVEEQYFAEHSYDFVVLTQETIIEIDEEFTVDTENWIKENPVTINDTTFDLWVRRDLSGAQCPYTIGEDTCEDSDIELTYTLKIKK